MRHFQGCTALITGASSGIGEELARQLAPHARCLLLVARRRDRLEALKAAIARPGLTIICFNEDLATEAGREALLAQVRDSGERVTLLINNAGVGDHGLFEDSDWPRAQAMLELNIAALTRLTHAFLPDLVRSGRGAILNVSSIAALLPVPRMAVYAATKAYVSSFSEALRAELRGTGVTVTAVCPGPVDTEFSKTAERVPGGDSMPAPDFFKIPVSEVARAALRAVANDSARVLPGLLVCVVMTLASVVPIFILRLFLSRGVRLRKPHHPTPRS